MDDTKGMALNQCLIGSDWITIFSKMWSATISSIMTNTVDFFSCLGFARDRDASMSSLVAVDRPSPLEAKPREGRTMKVTTGLEGTPCVLPAYADERRTAVFVWSL